jgi:acyl-CoA hydrolase
VNGIGGRPLFQLFECFAEVVQDGAVDLFDRPVITAKSAEIPFTIWRNVTSFCTGSPLTGACPAPRMLRESRWI